MVIEGTADEINRFVNTITAEMARYIVDTTEVERPAAELFDGFGVRY